MADHKADVVIVGAGVAGSIVAYELGRVGIEVLLIESGPAIDPSREDNLERFYTATAKLPESPYPPNPNAPNARAEHLGKEDWNKADRTYLDQSDSRQPFGSTYERRAGGTCWHWMGTSLRLVPNDFQMRTKYGVGDDWPITYQDLGQAQVGETKAFYDMAEEELGVSADISHQSYLGITFENAYRYPNPPIRETLTDKFFRRQLENAQLQFDGCGVFVSPTPAARQSRPTLTRRACAGNTSCIPICPIQAKYDPTLTLHKAFSTGHVRAIFQAVASRIMLDANKRNVDGIEVVRYGDPKKASAAAIKDTVKGRIYVLAGNAIETPKLMLHSGLPNKNIGRYLMDHPFYLRWGLTPEQTYPYRGPLATSGIESLRDGKFRRDRAAFRVEIGNEGWNLTAGDPYTTTLDWIDGTNESQTNPDKQTLHGQSLIRKLNEIFTRQFRFGFLIEQIADPNNNVTLSEAKDALGLPRPKIRYDLSDYTKRGFLAARQFADRVFETLKIRQMSKQIGLSGAFQTGNQDFEFIGAGHIMGTYRMGKSPDTSVVDRNQRSWEHPNLYLVGSGVFPTGGTANPTLTIAALCFWAAKTIKKDLKG